VGSHESMTCEVHGIYLKFGSFNGIDPIVPMLYVTFGFNAILNVFTFPCTSVFCMYVCEEA
jgi:hypothetical protein